MPLPNDGASAMHPPPHPGNFRARRPGRAPAAIAWVLVLAAPAAAEPARYALDPVHTRVLFAIDHAGFSRALGTVSGSTGQVVFDPEDWSSARVEVEVPLARLDLGDADWNAAALRMLDAGAHPVARFVSRRIEPVAADAARVCGDLTLGAATRDFCLHVQFNQLRRYPLPPFRRTAGFSAAGDLSRGDFGLTRWASLVGDTVELRIEAEAHYLGPAGDAPAADAPAQAPRPADPGGRR
jgi:polyisoprenoid-binding protein YceI